MVCSFSLSWIRISIFSPAQSLLSSPVPPLYRSFHFGLLVIFNSLTAQIPTNLPPLFLILRLQSRSKQPIIKTIPPTLASSTTNCIKSPLLPHNPAIHLSSALTISPSLSCPLDLENCLILLMGICSILILITIFQGKVLLKFLNHLITLLNIRMAYIILTYNFLRFSQSQKKKKFPHLEQVLIQSTT